ncbi:MAG TPA: glycosyltransferase family 4 protein, partial [Caulobacteraceae bacterium]|nr:glycosyltransferase family 4 protein [Caulobacteraceae bacterium]
LTYVGPIAPPVIPWEKAASKALRLAGVAGDFAAFSERRLAAVAQAFEPRARSDAALDFFHGTTLWAATRPKRPYVAWGDCAFFDYIDIFHDRSRFRAEDLARIEAAEARWLRAAQRVVFTSDWAAGRTVSRYGLDPKRVGCVGIFGEAEPPAADAWRSGAEFVFVSTDFKAKGGPVVVEALSQVRRSHPGATLTVIGAAPSELSTAAGVAWAGYLRKEAPEEDARFREILGRAVALVHPTRSDIAPLILVEAALFGCPAIASRAFAIPELVTDSQTGWLLDRPQDPGEVAAAMRRVLDEPARYRLLRANAWRKARDEHSKARFTERLLAAVDAALAEAGVAAA